MLGPHQMGLKKTTAVFTGVRKLDICGFVSLDAAFKDTFMTWLFANNQWWDRSCGSTFRVWICH